MDNKYNYTGLTYDQVEESRKINGRNIIHLKEDNVILQVFTHIVLEPMFILLVIVAVIYFIIARYQDGSIMLLAILFVAGISFFQNFRSRRAVEALNKFHSSNPLVIRENTVQQILPQDVVVGDILLIEEGEMIAADGFILSSNDLSIDESILTGESIPVAKSEKSKDIVYKNTLVNNGSAIIKVDAVGRNTRAGRIGSMMRAVQVERTPLQILFCNLMLTLENRSDKLSIFYILSFRNNLMVAVFIINLLFIGAIMFMPYIQKIFMVETPSIFTVVVCILTALAGTMWVELWKYYIRKKEHS